MTGYVRTFNCAVAAFLRLVPPELITEVALYKGLVALTTRVKSKDGGAGVPNLPGAV